ncbi:hypothetical protein [Caulobacter vibrioides]|uniref:Uncharacterized protein n=1 Tax=Caulobacter vibrioides (strain NA1000 / CB15N) TaxID=565050 RepID=A0A0H3C8I3_CAUVN|nr:hypothetical protein [Caulobacter vibrioides]YP_002516422.1 hypothetical protein CCNA_01049 [Caulobacter vibrioides NA1000]ACL94514.1 hypothetical protein CCNA_01049 [Caulobacter vibrioides NA1000]QXZ53075.1 hypothetical protein KZH45_05235 [Caulobacter vibrioides]
MDQASRLRSSALVEVLTRDGDTFPIAAGRELISLIPVSSGLGAPLRIDTAWQGPTSGMAGAAAGVGTVALSGEGEDRRWSFGSPPIWRCGLYTLCHRPGRLQIEQLFADTFEDQTGRAFVLQYDRRTGRPTRLLLQVEQALSLGPIRLGLARFRDWKRPV